MGFPAMTFSKEAVTVDCGIVIQKNAPFKEEVDAYVGQSLAMGLPTKYLFDPVIN
jgi:hypothetical protein